MSAQLSNLKGSYTQAVFLQIIYADHVGPPRMPPMSSGSNSKVVLSSDPTQIGCQKIQRDCPHVTPDCEHCPQLVQRQNELRRK